MEKLTEPVIEWGVAGLPLAGNRCSGDAYAIRQSPTGILIAVVDGLGHGEEACRAAQAATGTLMNSPSDDLFQLSRECHEALVRTRGVAMSLVFFDRALKTITWMGVGNVEGYLKRSAADAVPDHESLPLRGGVVGYRLPPLHCAAVSVFRGDTVVLVTDGIAGCYDRIINCTDAPQRLADQIFATCGKKNDDALVLVARYTG